MSFPMNNFVYQLGKDETNKGIMIPRYRALGRTSPDGKVYPDTEVAKKDEFNLVPVKSIISKVDGDLSVVTPDLISKRFNDLTPGGAVGLSFSTSLTENITQSILGLKHGGHERVMLTEGYLYAPDSGTFSEEGRFMYLKRPRKTYKWPRPSNLVTAGKTEINSGELMCAAYNTTSPIYKLNALIKLLGARGSAGIKYYEKDDVIFSNCYAYEEGKIRYVESKKGDIEVWIGPHNYGYNPNCMYYYPEGTEIKQFQRFCSGVVDISKVFMELGPSKLNDVYTIFRKQFYTLIDKNYLSKGYVSSSSSQEELIELLFVSIISKKTDDTSDIKELEYRGVHNAIMNKSSFYTALSYGYSRRSVEKSIEGKSDLTGDVMTETVLGLLLDNKLQ